VSKSLQWFQRRPEITSWLFVQCKMQLIFIGGAQRSGTTLLQTLLANALNAPLLPEAHILCDILAAFKRAKEFGHKTSFFYATQNDLSNFFHSITERHI